jgi:hypothetical protein
MNDLKLGRSVKRHLFVALLLVGLVTSGCSGKRTPPGPNSAYGAFESAAYNLFRWEDGPSILMWHDASGSGTCHGSGSTEDPVYHMDCSAQGADGSELAWSLESAEGETVEMRINGADYDLSDGNLFLIRTQAGGTDITQLQKDLTGITLERDSILGFAQSDPDISTFLQSLPSE